jgi:hypothetical protein
MSNAVRSTVELFLKAMATLIEGDTPGTMVMFCVSVQRPSAVVRTSFTSVALCVAICGAPQFPLSPKPA